MTGSSLVKRHPLQFIRQVLEYNPDTAARPYLPVGDHGFNGSGEPIVCLPDQRSDGFWVVVFDQSMRWS